jgi:small subunit ribosomal protein S12
MITYNQLGTCLRKKKKKKVSLKALKGSPMRKGVCVKVYTTTPKKPNSAIRKVAKVALTSGRKVIVGIPGAGHNLIQYSVVLVRGGRSPDVPGVKYKLIKNKYDFTGLENFNRMNRRSKFGKFKDKNAN